MYYYMQIIETKERNFIQKLDRFNIIQWSGDYPEYSTKRMKYFDDQEGKDLNVGQGRMITSYLEDIELLQQLSQTEIMTVLGFLDSLMKGVIEKNQESL